MPDASDLAVLQELYRASNGVFDRLGDRLPDRSSGSGMSCPSSQAPNPWGAVAGSRGTKRPPATPKAPLTQRLRPETDTPRKDGPRITYRRVTEELD
jgi:hypothetical protein